MLLIELHASFRELAKCCSPISAGFAMSKFEWMELETLSSEITHIQTRLDAARATKNLGLVQLLEREVADALNRRAQVLTSITKGLGFTRARPKLATAPVQQPQSASMQQQEAAEVAEPERVAAAVGTDLGIYKEKGVDIMWDKLTAADLERVQRGLTTRRSEMLARHAEELKALEAEQNEIDVIKKAIAAFAQKFNLRNTAEVIPLEGDRVPAQAG